MCILLCIWPKVSKSDERERERESEKQTCVATDDVIGKRIAINYHGHPHTYKQRSMVWDKTELQKQGQLAPSQTVTQSALGLDGCQ